MLRRFIIPLLALSFLLVAFSPVLAARRVEVEVILLVDTSDSMEDELSAVCDGLEGLVSDLARRGVTVHAVVLGVADTRACATDQVTTLVPDGRTEGTEDWGLAVADLARDYEWRANAVHMIVPLSDEGPLEGDPVDADDGRVVRLAIQAARASGVVVSPVLGTELNPEVEPLARQLAEGTDGGLFVTEKAAAEIADGLRELIREVAERARRADTMLEAIPEPEDVVFDGQVVSTNLVTAILTTLVVGMSAAILYDTLDANREGFSTSRLGRLWGVGSNLVGMVEGLFAPGEWSRFSIRSRRLLVALQLGFMLVLTTFFGLFMQPGLSPGSTHGLALWLGLLLALALITFVYEAVHGGMAARTDGEPTLRLRPGAPLTAFTSVLLSRLAGFLPGFFFGMVTISSATDLPTGRRVRIALAGLIAVAVVGSLLWFLVIPIGGLVNWITELDASSAWDEPVIAVLDALRGFFLLGFFIGLQMLLFELLPQPSNASGLLFRRHRLLWALPACGVLFVWLQFLLNPYGTATELLESGGLVLLLLASFFYSALALGVWILFALRMGEERAADVGYGQWTSVMAISLLVLWILGACFALVAFLVNLFD